MRNGKWEQNTPYFILVLLKVLNIRFEGWFNFKFPIWYIRYLILLDLKFGIFSYHLKYHKHHYFQLRRSSKEETHNSIYGSDRSPRRDNLVSVVLYQEEGARGSAGACKKHQSGVGGALPCKGLVVLQKMKYTYLKVWLKFANFPFLYVC